LASDYQRCAELIAQADGLLITAGAGIGVDSGLPDFRGTQGFWSAYPALGRARIAFEQIANAAAFEGRPRLAWGFYGHRLQLYRRTVPHQGFAILRRIGDRLAHGSFVFTSNVDGQFQKAGFADDHISECHGSIHHLQCIAGCEPSPHAIWPADDFAPEIDEEQCLLTGKLPLCPRCAKIARPNILMFGDWGWLEQRSNAQDSRLQAWLRRVEHPVVIEVGAGTHIPTVRLLGERLKGSLIRINPREAQLPDGKNSKHGKGDQGVAIAAGALEALRAIAASLE
jgi:NAD-dependent SIR2 family protein deacetylase